MAESTIHPNHAANMVLKADRIKRFVIQHCGVLATYEDVQDLSEGSWERIRQLAGEARPISPETRAATIALFKAAEQDRANHPDPFAGIS